MNGRFQEEEEDSMKGTGIPGVGVNADNPAASVASLVLHVPCSRER